MRNPKTPDARPGVVSTSIRNWPPVTPEEIDEDIRCQNAEQDDTHRHLEMVGAANRVLRFLYRAHSPNRAKAWQTQIALITHSDYEPGVAYEPRWGVIATVYVHHPREAEFRKSWWAPTWREAIETAVAEMATL
jgi:hypothetical protein